MISGSKRNCNRNFVENAIDCVRVTIQLLQANKLRNVEIFYTKVYVLRKKLYVSQENLTCINIFLLLTVPIMFTFSLKLIFLKAALANF